MAFAEDEVNSVAVDKVDHFYRKSELYKERRGKPHLQSLKWTISTDEAHLQITEYMIIGTGHSVYVIIVWTIHIVRKIL